MWKIPAESATYRRDSTAFKYAKIDDSDAWAERGKTGTVNILTAVDARYPVTTKDDLRHGIVADQFKRILQDRESHRLIMLGE